MGLGCQSVQRARTTDGRIEIIGFWPDGRKGVFREDKDFHGFAKGPDGESPVGSFNGYEPLLAQIVNFFQTGIPPVQPKETIEIFAFMEAADASRQQGGAAVPLKKILKQNGD